MLLTELLPVPQVRQLLFPGDPIGLPGSVGTDVTDCRGGSKAQEESGLFPGLLVTP